MSVKVKVKDGKMDITGIPVTGTRPSSSGKMDLYYVTGGFKWDMEPSGGYGISLIVGKSDKHPPVEQSE